MTVDVSPLNKNSTHHISLAPADGSGTKYGLILTPNGNAIERRPKVGSTHTPFTQNDWSGGRGLKFATDDRSRFADSKRLNTRRAGLITLGGMETYVTGHRQAEQYMPADAAGLTWQSLLTTHRYIITRTTASATGNRARLCFWVRRRGTPTSTLTVLLRAESGGLPGATLKTVTMTTSDITDTISQLLEFTFSSVQAVTSTTNYWIQIYTSTADTATDYWQVGTDAARGQALTRAGSDGITYNNTTYDLYYRLVDDLDIAGSIPFKYKQQQYFLTRPTAAAAPKLYINGYRGVATGAGQSRTALQDSTQSFGSANSLVGCVIYIVDGKNSQLRTPYRVISSNTSDTVSWVTPFPQAVIAASSAYVILGTNILTEIASHGLTDIPTSIADAGDVLYFAQGDEVKMRRMQERNLAGVWTRTFAEEDNFAKLLLAYPDETNRGTMIIKANDYDNSNRPSVATAKAEAWGVRLRFPLLIDACESATAASWTASANVTKTTDSAVYKAGSSSLKLVVGVGAPTLLVYRSITTAQLRNNKKFRMWIHSSETLEAGALKLRLSTSASCATAITNGELSFPMINADEWTLVELPYKDNAVAGVVTFGVIKTAATGTIYLDGIELLPAGSEVPLGNENERINGLELYGDPSVPWVLRSGSIGWIANGTFNPVPLREFSQVEGIFNGAGHLVHDVYLYTSFGQGLEEYYRANLDDVGPNKDEGLPEDRQGYITSMAGYPDRFLYNYDAGGDGYSSIMSRKGSGHHEDYRSDTSGKRIRFVYVQIIPGATADRLWFSEGEDIAFLPMPGNTVNELTDPTYEFTHEGVLEMAWLGDDQQRLFSSVKLGTENANASRCIEWDYKIDEASAWTAMSTAFTSGPVQELPLNKTGKRLKLRFRPQSNSNTSTPRITSIYISTTEQPTPRYAYSMNAEARDNGFDLLKQKENYSRVETLATQLDTWAAAKTPMTMRSISEMYDNKTVFLEPMPIRPVDNETREQQEKVIITITAIEPT
jgi:hypothetical protein